LWFINFLSHHKLLCFLNQLVLLKTGCISLFFLKDFIVLKLRIYLKRQFDVQVPISFLCLQNVVAMVMIVVHWCIPNMSSRLHDQIRQEAYITNEIIIRQEALRARGCVFGGDTSSGDGDRNPYAQWGHLSGSNLDLSMAQHELETADAVRKRWAWETRSSDRPVTV
jgi:hypothetical protein